jgi:quercetin dioxygenase-like cupin family protein
MTQRKIWTIASLALIVLAGAVLAQNSGITRTFVAKADVSVPNREGIVARVELTPGAAVGWHTHPGEELSYVTDGELTLVVAGQPSRKVLAGEGFVIPAGVVHNATNEGNSAMKAVAVYIVEKGKPLLSPAPPPVQ